MVRVDILTAIANYGVVSNTRLGWAGEGLTGAIAQTSSSAARTCRFLLEDPM